MNQKTTNLRNAHGAIPYGMTNDYMFRAVLQTNNKALRGLICSLLHLQEEDILSVEITNPIVLGESIKNKEFRLDINVILNNYSHINIEMQVTGKRIWPDRSVSYLCRSIDMLNHGQDYSEVQPVIHIGFLDYTLFDDYPEFYAIYKLLNVKNHHIYSDKLTLSVVDLSRIDLATDEDKEYHIDYWAKLFKATTWEEIKMLAAKDEYINEASNTIFTLSAEDQIRKRCRDREDYYRDMRTYEKDIESYKNMIVKIKKDFAKNEKALAESKNTLAENEKALAESKKALTENERALAENEKTLAENEKTIAENEKTIAENEKTIAENQLIITEKDSKLAEQEKLIENLLSEIAMLKGQK